MRLQNNRKKLVQEKLELRILHGLVCEWEAAIWVLVPAHRNLMRKPLFCLRDMKSRLGYWSRKKREICLSRDLVVNHPWDSVCDVLGHEMAHQLAEEVLGVCDEPPHGPTFQKACALLRANPKASGTYRTLHERIFGESQDARDKIMLRIKKLMALAESCNPHEAEAAMLKARELIAKYNIDLLERNEHRDFVSIFVGKPALRHRREEYHLAHLIQDFYFVEGIWASAYVVEKGKMGRVLEISGTVQNIKIAAYIYDFVTRFIDSRWAEYNRKKRLNHHRKTDFAAGIIEGFQSKLESQASEKENKEGNDASELVRIEDPLLRKYIKYKYPRTTRFSRRISSQDANVLNDGIEAGKKLVISQGITEKKKSGKLLEGGQ
ncbi:DUF2786 domain-containing protein [Desulfobacterales bacterium HSG2]|nr:DUF2786 domain-containing protein [Desulfobacterales bacterium HSG2]